jgi:hypothetical protein
MWISLGVLTRYSLMWDMFELSYTFGLVTESKRESRLEVGGVVFSSLSYMLGGHHVIGVLLLEYRVAPHLKKMLFLWGILEGSHERLRMRGVVAFKRTQNEDDNRVIQF